MSTTGTVTVNHLRRRITVLGTVTAGQLARAIDVAEAEHGSKVMRYWIEWGDAPKKSRVKVRNYHIEAGMPASFPDADE